MFLSRHIVSKYVSEGDRMYDCYRFIKNEGGAYFTSNMESRGGVTTIEQLQEGDLVTLETRKLDG